MKALIEASAACDQRAGIGRYSRNILSRLLSTGKTDDWTLVRAPGEHPGDCLFDVPVGANTRLVTLPLSRRNADRLWFRLRLPIDGRVFTRRPADVVYSPDFTAPPALGVPRMITIHDLAFVTHPETTTDALRRFMERVVPREVERADKIAVVSRATRNDVERLLGVPRDKIVLAPNAVDSAFYKAEVLSAQRRERLGLPSRYLLMLGTIEPRKNHLNALRAIEASGVGKDVPLVLAGRPGWGYESVMPYIERLSQRGLVIPLEYVPEADLVGLLAGAQGLLYPSWTEGFGLPVIEALATGIPVITGTAPALQEAGGDLARYADPADIDGLSSHIRQIATADISDDERRERREWTRQFSWDYSTSTVYENLRSLAERSRNRKRPK